MKLFEPLSAIAIVVLYLGAVIVHEGIYRGAIIPPAEPPSPPVFSIR